MRWRGDQALVALALLLAAAGLGLDQGGVPFLGTALLLGAIGVGVVAVRVRPADVSPRAIAAGLGHVLRRLGWAGVVIAGVCTVAFVLARTLPGDPTRLLVGPQARPADVERARRIYGLDAPLSTQYVRFWTRLIHRRADSGDHAGCAEAGLGMHLDLGYSFRYRQPVTALIAQRAPRSAWLALAALTLQALLGLGVGIVAARRRGTALDQLAVGATLVGVSAPTFLLGVLLQYVLAYKLRWLPYDGYGETTAEQLRALVLPALTLGVFGTALYARLSRDELIRVLAQDHVRAARGRGASELRVTLVHALRTSLLPIVTLLVLDLGTLVGGAVVTEKLFRWPGMGYLAVDALVNRDGPVILGTVLFAAMAIVAASLLLDVLQVVLDPRLRRAAPESP